MALETVANQDEPWRILIQICMYNQVNNKKEMVSYSICHNIMWSNTSTGFHTEKNKSKQTKKPREGEKLFSKYRNIQIQKETLRTFDLLNFFTELLSNDLIPVFYTLTVKILQIVASSQIWYAKKSKWIQMAH